MKLNKALRKAADLHRENILVSPRGVIYAFDGDLLLARKDDGSPHHWVVDIPESAVALGRYGGKRPWSLTHRKVALHLEIVDIIKAKPAPVPRINRPGN